MTEFRDDFSGRELDAGRWLDHYLPHWTTAERSRARYDLGAPGGGLRLRIDADQPAWRPEDGDFRVSSLQTGSFAGPVGSTRGQHRHRTDGLVVRTPVPTRRLWTPTSGRVEITATGCREPTAMLAFWLVGVEDRSPRDSGEICIAELFGDRIGTEASTVRLGVKAHHDPRLTDEMHDLDLPIDAGARHAYGVEWDATGIRFAVDGRVVATSAQVIAYPLQLMLDLWEFPTDTDTDADADRDPDRYPFTATVHAVDASSPSASTA